MPTGPPPPVKKKITQKNPTNVATFDPAGWNSGKVTLFSALGLRGAQYPALNARLVGPAAANSIPLSQFAPQAQSGGGGGGGVSGTAPGNAKHYSYLQLQQLWQQAGGNPAKSKMAAAIAEAESSGDSNATNHNTNGTVDRGLWQINSTHGSLSVYDPLKNARAAVSISSNGTNWNPWTTFTSGAYRKFLQ